MNGTLSQALDEYLKVENTDPSTARRALANFVAMLGEATGTDRTGPEMVDDAEDAFEDAGEAGSNKIEDMQSGEHRDPSESMEDNGKILTAVGALFGASSKKKMVDTELEGLKSIIGNRKPDFSLAKETSDDMIHGGVGEAPLRPYKPKEDRLEKAFDEHARDAQELKPYRSPTEYMTPEVLAESNNILKEAAIRASKENPGLTTIDDILNAIKQNGDEKEQWIAKIVQENPSYRVKGRGIIADSLTAKLGRLTSKGIAP